MGRRPAAAATGSIAVSNNALRIGGNAVWSEWFAGTIDEVRVYDRALTAAELQTDMVTPIGAAHARRRDPSVGARLAGGQRRRSAGSTSRGARRATTWR